MGTYKLLDLSLVNGNVAYKNALTNIINHSAHLKQRYAGNKNKREIEDLFTVLKKKFFEEINMKVMDATSLVGPDILDHLNNYDTLPIRNILIPEINLPTLNIMRNDATYLVNTSRINLIYGDFFNETLKAMNYEGYVFSDIDFDGTAFYKSCKTALSQFLYSLHSHRSSLTKRFTFVTTFSRRGLGRAMMTHLYKAYEQNVLKIIHGMSGFNVKEAHYIDYSGMCSMTTVILLIEQIGKVKDIFKSSSPPELHYYTHLNGGGLPLLKGRVKNNSNYI
jgi:hypothetical protein